MGKNLAEMNCHVEPVNKIIGERELTKKASLFLSVWGMGCSNCAMRVRNSLISVDGVVDTYVDYRAGTAWVIFNPDLVCTPLLTPAVEQAGRDSGHEYWAAILA